MIFSGHFTSHNYQNNIPCTHAFLFSKVNMYCSSYICNYIFLRSILICYQFYTAHSCNWRINDNKWWNIYLYIWLNWMQYLNYDDFRHFSSNKKNVMFSLLFFAEFGVLSFLKYMKLDNWHLLFRYFIYPWYIAKTLFVD